MNILSLKTPMLPKIGMRSYSSVTQQQDLAHGGADKHLCNESTPSCSVEGLVHVI